MSEYRIERYPPSFEKEVEGLVRSSFWDVYRPGAVEHLLLRVIRKQKEYLPELEFVLFQGGKIIGQNLFYPGVFSRGNAKVLIPLWIWNNEGLRKSSRERGLRSQPTTKPYPLTPRQ